MLLRWLRGSYGYPAWWAGLVLALFLPASSGTLQATENVALAHRSPFLPPGFTPPAERVAPVRRAAGAARQSGEPKFRGVYAIGGQYRFLISEPTEQSGSWVGLKERDGDFFVHAYHEDKQEIEIEINGARQTLALASVSSTHTPLPVSGQTLAATAPNRRSVVAPGAPQPPVRRRLTPPLASNPNDLTGQTRRRITPPPPPNWTPPGISGGRNDVTSSGNLNNTGPSGVPTGVPGPPPNFIPPMPPEGFDIPEMPAELMNGPPVFNQPGG